MLPSFSQTCAKGLIKIIPIDTKEQIADAVTKPLAKKSFLMPLLLYVWQATSISYQSEGVLLY
jgi:hypothetical protein